MSLRGLAAEQVLPRTGWFHVTQVLGLPLRDFLHPLAEEHHECLTRGLGLTPAGN